MNIDLTKVLKVSGLLLAVTSAVIATICSTSKNSNSSNSFESWLGTKSDDDLENEYETRRLEWLKDGAGDKTPEMTKIDSEMSRRAAERWEKDPKRNTDPNFRWTDANRWDTD